MATLAMLSSAHSPSVLPLDKDALDSPSGDPAVPRSLPDNLNAASVASTNDTSDPRRASLDVAKLPAPAKPLPDPTSAQRQLSSGSLTATQKQQLAAHQQKQQVQHLKRSASGILPIRSQYAMVLVLTPLNGTFDKKSLIVPFAPEVLKLGRQTNNKTVPGPDNGFFDSRVLSRQHAEVWADKSSGKVWIKDAKSSNGTYINKHRLSSDNMESAPHELKKNDVLELGIDICGDDGVTLVHRKISAKVERVSIMSLLPSNNLTSGSANGNAATPNGLSTPNGSISGASMVSSTSTIKSHSGPKLRRMGMGIGGRGTDALDVALFGDVDATLEDLIMGHSRNSVGGLFMNSGLSNSMVFEAAIKRLIEEIHIVKQEKAKISSVITVLQKIQVRQKQTGVLSAISDRLSVENTYIRDLETKVKDKEAAEKLLVQEQAKTKKLERENELLQKRLTELLESPLEETMSDLASVRTQLEFFKARAKEGESQNIKNGRINVELKKSLDQERSSVTKHEQDAQVHQQQILVLQQTIQQMHLRHQQELDEIKEQSLTHSPGLPNGITVRTKDLVDDDTVGSASSPTIIQPHQAFAVKAVPMTTALGVVVLGISLMSYLNRFSREKW